MSLHLSWGRSVGVRLHGWRAVTFAVRLHLTRARFTLAARTRQFDKLESRFAH